MNADSITIINLSSSACSDEISGHPHWFHRRISELKLEAVKSVVTLGSRFEASHWIRGVLTHSGLQRPSSGTFLWWDLISDVNAVSREFERVEGRSVFHVYEGGFREFFTVLILLKRYEHSRAIFNFNFADPWHRVFRRTPSTAFARWLFKRAIRDLDGRLFKMAETKNLSEVFSKSLNAEFLPYPLFSNFLQEDLKRADSSFKPIDIVFFPSNFEEARLVTESIKQVEDSLGRPLEFRMIPRWGYEPTSQELRALSIPTEKITKGVLSHSEYFESYIQSKVAVFPYLDPVYEFSSSGRVLDAASMGCYCIAPVGSQPGFVVVEQNLGSAFSSSGLALEIQKGLSVANSRTVKPRSAEDAFNLLLTVCRPVQTQSNSSPMARFELILLGLALILATGARQWIPRLLQASQNFFKHGLAANQTVL